eukprot:1058386-Pelagomonas_calceolata.AAC.1
MEFSLQPVSVAAQPNVRIKLNKKKTVSLVQECAMANSCNKRVKCFKVYKDKAFSQEVRLLACS